MTQISEPAPSIDQLSGLDEYVQDLMQDWSVPGLALAIVKDGEVIQLKGFGKRDLATGQEVTPQTTFAIGSVTKAFTTTVMGTLVDEGKLDWDTPVRNYLPSFKLYDPQVAARITPRDLVIHNSGLPGHDMVHYRSNFSRQEIIQRLAYLEPNKSFRSTWQYQNMMYVTAGYLSETIAGQSWESLVQQRIFEPLGMNSSSFSATAARSAPDHALPYEKRQDALHAIDFDFHWEGIGPAGNIHSTAQDMSKWLLFQFSKGKAGDKQVISEAQLASIHTPQICVPGPRQHPEMFYSSYAYGWGVTSYRGRTMLFHSGGIDGFTSYMTFLPDEQLGIVVLTNRSNCGAVTPVAHHAYDLLLGLDPIDWNANQKQEFNEMQTAFANFQTQSDKECIPDTSPSLSLDAYTGTFEHPGYGTITTNLHDDQLKMNYHVNFSLTHYHYNTFNFTYRLNGLVITLKIHFTLNAQGKIDGLTLEPFPRLLDKPVTFKRVQATNA